MHYWLNVLRDTFHRQISFCHNVFWRIFGVRCDCGCGTWKHRACLCARQAQAIVSKLLDEAWVEQEAINPSPRFDAGFFRGSGKTLSSTEAMIVEQFPDEEEEN